MSRTELQIHIYSFSQQVTMGSTHSVYEIETRCVLHRNTVQSLLNEKKRLYNLK